MKRKIVKRMFKKLFWTLVPHIIVIVLGLNFYYFATIATGDFKSLLLSVSATLLVIPVLYFGYQVFHQEARNKIENDIYEYFKAQVDISCLTIYKHFHGYLSEPTSDVSSNALKELVDQKKVKSKINGARILGFNLFRTFIEEEKNIDSILKSSAIQSAFTPTQRITLVNLVKVLTFYRTTTQDIAKFDMPYKHRDDLKIVAGQAFSSENSEFSNRYILLKYLDQNRSQVIGFGDYPAYLSEKLLNEYLISEPIAEITSKIITDLCIELSEWLRLTGNVFLIRTDQFRLRNGGI